MSYTDKQKKLIVENLEAIADRDLEIMYEDTIDECYGCVKIAGIDYYTSYALKTIDSIAFRCGRADWLDSQITEGLITDEIDGSHYLHGDVDAFLESLEGEETGDGV